MIMRRALLIAAAFGLACAASPAWAQMPPGAGQQQMPPCLQKFVALRKDAEAKAKRLDAAGKRKQKPTAQQACQLFTVFSVAEEKLVKYSIENQTWCGIPPQVVANMKKAHARTTQTRARICRVAAEMRSRPRGPTLSDALGAPAPDANNIKTGRGTYDTLTGSALGNR